MILECRCLQVRITFCCRLLLGILGILDCRSFRVGLRAGKCEYRIFTDISNSRKFLEVSRTYFYGSAVIPRTSSFQNFQEAALVCYHTSTKSSRFSSCRNYRVGTRTYQSARKATSAGSDCRNYQAALRASYLRSTELTAPSGYLCFMVARLSCCFSATVTSNRLTYGCSKAG